LLLLSTDGIADANTLEAQEKALKVIADFAERLCTTIPLTGGANNLELSGKAKAELSELVKRIANLGLEGAAKYQTSDWQGVLQQDLAAQLNDSRNCKREVFKDLQGKLLVSVENAPKDKPPPPPPHQINITGIWRDTLGNMSQITQHGSAFQFTGWGIACHGNFQSSGSGTIRENSVESTYRSTYSEGICSGTVSPDGRQITSRCNDSACGSFMSFGERQ
jgi:hypothetical protein